MKMFGDRSLLSYRDSNDVNDIYFFSCLTSLSACLIVLIMYPILRRFSPGYDKTYFVGILLGRFIAYSIDTASAFIPSSRSSFMCTLQGSMQLFSEPSIILYILWMSVACYRLICGKKPFLNEKWAHIVCWSCGVVCVVVGVSTGAVGDAGGWCWLSDDHQFLRFALLYFWVYITCIVVVVCYSGMVVRLIAMKKRYQSGRRVNRPSTLGIVVRLLLYPILFSIMWILLSLGRLFEATGMNSQNEHSWQVLEALTFLEGFCNVIVFVIMERWDRVIKECCGSGHLLRDSEREHTPLVSP